MYVLTNSYHFGWTSVWFWGICSQLQLVTLNELITINQVINVVHLLLKRSPSDEADHGILAAHIVHMTDVDFCCIVFVIAV